MKNRMNPSQALLGSLLSSSMCFVGTISGLLIVNKVEANVEVCKVRYLLHGKLIILARRNKNCEYDLALNK